MAPKKLYKPGETPKELGQFEIVGPRGGRVKGEERGHTEGNRLGPTPEPNQRYRLVDRTRTKGRRKP